MGAERTIGGRPLLDRPWSLWWVISWLSCYILPWNDAVRWVGHCFWYLRTPSRGTLATLDLGRIALILLRDSALVFALYGALGHGLYVRRHQETHFKYNGRFPSDLPSDIFFFFSQNVGNGLRIFLSGLPTWTDYEALGLWAWVNWIGPWTTFDAQPLWWAAGKQNRDAR